MPGLISNFTNVTLTNITDIANSTDLGEIFVKMNWIIYGGWFWFWMMIILWWILFIAMQKSRDQLLNNMMYSGFVVSIISLFLRAVQVVVSGTLRSLLTDHQMWIFPVITAILAAIIWMIKE